MEVQARLLLPKTRFPFTQNNVMDNLLHVPKKKKIIN